MEDGKVGRGWGKEERERGPMDFVLMDGQAHPRLCTPLHDCISVKDMVA